MIYYSTTFLCIYDWTQIERFIGYTLWFFLYLISLYLYPIYLSMYESIKEKLWAFYKS